MSAPRGIRPVVGGKIIPVLWRCLCGQLNSVDDRRCIACGRERSF